MNIHGLKPKTKDSKVPFINDIAVDKKQIFIALTETWLQDEKDAEVSIKGYTIFRADRKRERKRRGRNSGGAAIYVRDDIANTFEKTIAFSNGTVELLCIHSRPENLLIANIYRQPDDIIGDHRSTAKEFNEAIKKLEKHINDIQTRSPNIILTGDFNLPHAIWPDGTTRQGASTDEQNMVNKLNEIAEEFLLTQYISKSTHINGNTLDLLFTNNDQLIHSYNIIETIPTISDHHTIEVLSNLKMNTNNENKTGTGLKDVPPIKKLNFHNDSVDWAKIKEDLGSTEWHMEFRRLSPNQMVERIQNICYDIAVQHVPPCKTTSKSNSIPKDRKALMRRRNRINKRLLHITSPTQKEKLRKELVQIEKELQKSRKQSRIYQEKKAIEAIKKNAKYFFTYAKKFSKTKTTIGPLLDEKEEYVHDNHKMANLLQSQYKSVYSVPENPLPKAKDLFPDEKSCLEDIAFNEDDLISAIDELSDSSGSGPDCFPAILLKRCKEQLATPLYILWRRCLDEGITPNTLKQPHIIPKHKGGSMAEPSNFRPIALT